MYKKYIFIILFPLWAYSANCPDTFIKIDAICYYKEHIDILQDFIDLNASLQGLDPQNLGSQEWYKGKLISLYLGDHLLKRIPDSIGGLSDLQYLDLQKNKLSYLPEGICNLYSCKHNRLYNLYCEDGTNYIRRFKINFSTTLSW